MPELRDEHTDANVVAKKDGLVTLVQLYGGHAEVSKGSTVTEGQLLISGIADIGDLGAYITRGEGDVYKRQGQTLSKHPPVLAAAEPHLKMWRC